MEISKVCTFRLQRGLEHWRFWQRIKIPLNVVKVFIIFLLGHPMVVVDDMPDMMNDMSECISLGWIGLTHWRTRDWI